MDYTVEYYEKDDGSRPAEEFILSQDNKMQAKIFAALELLESKGPALREPYSKVLDDGIFEVRAKQGTDISRLESGTANPSLRTLKRLAAGMGMALKLEFIPTQTQI